MEPSRKRRHRQGRGKNFTSDSKFFFSIQARFVENPLGVSSDSAADEVQRMRPNVFHMSWSRVKTRFRTLIDGGFILDGAKRSLSGLKPEHRLKPKRLILKRKGNKISTAPPKQQQ